MAMSHDEFCPAADPSWSEAFCDCERINQIRADEREKIAAGIEVMRTSTPEIAYPFTHRTLIVAAEIARKGASNE